MQTTANATTIAARFLGLARAALAAAAARRAAAESFALYVPGHGTTGDYTTIEQAETARQRLPYTQRQRAIICDADGNALCR